MLDFASLNGEEIYMEETPGMPPSPPRNWWQRNWKWFVPTGCFTIIACFVLFFVCIISFVFGLIKSSEVYKTAVARAKNDQRVIAALGTPISEGFFSSGHVNTSGAEGDADLMIPISGPKGSAKIYVVATKTAGTWSYSKLTVDVDGGQPINLNENAPPPQSSVRPTENPGASPPSTQSGNVRITSVSLAREDSNGRTTVKDFKPEDNPQHLIVTLSEGNSGARIKSVWTNLNAGGATNQKLWEKELVMNVPLPRADFALTNSSDAKFPVGDYKIDVYLNDSWVQTVQYKVK